MRARKYSRVRHFSGTAAPFLYFKIIAPGFRAEASPLPTALARRSTGARRSRPPTSELPRSANTLSIARDQPHDRMHPGVHRISGRRWWRCPQAIPLGRAPAGGRSRTLGRARRLHRARGTLQIGVAGALGESQRRRRRDPPPFERCLARSARDHGPWDAPAVSASLRTLSR